MGNTIYTGNLDATEGIALGSHLFRIDTGLPEPVKYGGGYISAIADVDGSNILITSEGHSLIDGMEVTLFDSTDYDGTYTVSSATTDTFSVAASFVANRVCRWTSPNEYYSPEQHGGLFGIIYRKYYTGVLEYSTTYLEKSYSNNLVYSGGFAEYVSLVYVLPRGWSSSYVQLPRQLNKDVQIIQNAYTGHTFLVWVDYMYRS